MRYLLFVLILLAVPSFAQAEGCDNAGTQADMNDCAQRELRAADKELNGAYGELKSAYDKIDGATDALVAAQRAWIKFRDAECSLESQPSVGGSMRNVIYSNCMTRLTADRIGQIRVKLACQEGDMTCYQLDDSGN